MENKKTTLEFQGPFHFDQLKNLPDLNKPGIYIWGFMYHYDKENKKLGDHIDFNHFEKKYDEESMQFIPYYVGQTGKGNENLSKRLQKHAEIRKSHAAKYTRLSKDYMKSFFIDELFPIKYKRKPNYLEAIALNKSSETKKPLIEYFNNKAFLEEVYPNIQVAKKSGYPIDLQTDVLNDTLDFLRNENKNFWFCYTSDPDISKFPLTILETYIFWSLKGVTISETKKCPEFNPEIEIKGIESVRIFHKDDSQLIKPSTVFVGY